MGENRIGMVGIMAGGDLMPMPSLSGLVIREYYCEAASPRSDDNHLGAPYIKAHLDIVSGWGPRNGEVVDLTSARCPLHEEYGEMDEHGGRRVRVGPTEEWECVCTACGAPVRRRNVT